MRVFTFLLLFLIPQLLMAQYNWDFGLHVGGSNYLGDIGGMDKPARPWMMDMKINQTRWATGGFARYKLNQNFGIQVGLSYLRIEGADSLSTYPNRRSRNLSFRNDVFELALRGEYYFYSARDVGGTGRYLVDFHTYLFAGVGGFWHSPQTFYEGKWQNLQPLKTEGQDKPYSNIQMSFPVGVGMYFTYKKKHRFGWEFSWRGTITDYMDDISGFYADPDSMDSDLAINLANRRGELPGTDPSDPLTAGDDLIDPVHYGPGSIRGNPANKDSYLTTTLYYSYVLRGRQSFYRSKYNYIHGGKRKKRRARAKF